MLLPIIPDSGNFSFIVLVTFLCVVYRNIGLGKQIDRVINTSLWKSDLPRDKRQALFIVITNAKPTDINRFDDMAARYVSLPTKISAAVMYGIVIALHEHLDDDDKKKIMGALAAFAVGGIGIGGTRHGSLGLDCLFRCVFGAGFIGILHFLAEVSDVFLIKSIE